VTDSQEQGVRLERLIETLNHTQVSMAQFLGVSQGYVSQMVSGSRNISRRVLQNITNEFQNVNVRWLLTGEGEMFTEKKSVGVEEPTIPYEPVHEEDLHEEVRRLRRLVGVTALEKEVAELRARLKKGKTD